MVLGHWNYFFEEVYRADFKGRTLFFIDDSINCACAIRKLTVDIVRILINYICQFCNKLGIFCRGAHARNGRPIWLIFLHWVCQVFQWFKSWNCHTRIRHKSLILSPDHAFIGAHFVGIIELVQLAIVQNNIRIFFYLRKIICIANNHTSFISSDEFNLFINLPWLGFFVFKKPKGKYFHNLQFNMKSCFFLPI